MSITPIHLVVPLAIAAFAVMARLSKNPFLMIAAWIALGACMAFVLHNLVQALLQLVQLVH